MLDFIPIVLAVATIILASLRISYLRRKTDIIAMVLSMIASMLLIIAQLSWWTSALAGNFIGTQIADNIWLIFNSLVMIIFIIYSAPVRNTNDNRRTI